MTDSCISKRPGTYGSALRRGIALVLLATACVVGPAWSADEAATKPTPAPTMAPPRTVSNPPEGISKEVLAEAVSMPKNREIHNFTDEAAGWSYWKEKRGVKIYARKRPNSNIKEGVGVGIINASPCRVAQIVTDQGRMQDFMPFIQVSIVKCSNNFNQDWYCQYLKLPAISDRKYNLKLTKYNFSTGSECNLLLAWQKDNTTCPCTEDELKAHVAKYSHKSVMTVENEGYWYLKGIENNTKTAAEYYVFTDPGGSIPSWAQNMFVDEAIADVFDAANKRISQGELYPDCKCVAGEIP